MRAISTRLPSPAMIVACLALSVALSAGAAADLPGIGIVNSADIKDNSVRGKDIRNGAVLGKDVARDTITGANVSEGTLGTVPNASHADSASPSGPAGGALAGSYPNPGFAKTVTPLALTAGWQPDPTTTPVPAVWKDAYNVVHFRGAIARTSGSSYSPFTLPPEYRPTTTKYTAVLTGGGIGNLIVQPSGVVIVDWVSGNPYDFLGIEDATFEAGT